eukprot:1482396-Amphidinium_carterae.1
MSLLGKNRVLCSEVLADFWHSILSQPSEQRLPSKRKVASAPMPCAAASCHPRSFPTLLLDRSPVACQEYQGRAPLLAQRACVWAADL